MVVKDIMQTYLVVPEQVVTVKAAVKAVRVELYSILTIVAVLPA